MLLYTYTAYLVTFHFHLVITIRGYYSECTRQCLHPPTVHKIYVYCLHFTSSLNTYLLGWLMTQRIMNSNKMNGEFVINKGRQVWSRQSWDHQQNWQFKVNRFRISNFLLTKSDSGRPCHISHRQLWVTELLLYIPDVSGLNIDRSDVKVE